MSLLAVTSGDIASGVVEAEGVDFDGTYDYLSRSTDLVGNVDSKTFTFSAWVYVGILDANDKDIFVSDSGNAEFLIRYDGTKKRLEFRATNSAGTQILGSYVTLANSFITNTFLHINMSIDLTSTSKRFIYINDIAQTVTWSPYTNDTINFTNTNWKIAVGLDGTSRRYKGRLSNIFLDYVYRDLSIEANRRLFITADGKPTPTATLKALNPILYLPMKDAATAHINEGTGGSFTANGTFATSNRGANQDNCVASTFDGTADYLSRTSLTGIADGKQFTFSCSAKTDVIELRDFLNFGGTSTGTYTIFIKINTTGGVSIAARNSAGTTILSASVTSCVVIGKTISILISIDLSDVNKRFVYINGALASVTWTTYTNDLIDLTTINYRIGASHLSTPDEYYKGNIGELYFDTKYIDLATSNPFWDSVENKPVPVRKVIANTGVTPLIAMPLDASNAGKNYGTGGDFTANSAPYVGARGASEFWARSAKFDGSTGYLSRGALTGAVDSKTFSLVLAVNYTTTDAFISIDNGTQQGLQLLGTSVLCKNIANSIIASIALGSFSPQVNTQYIYTVSVNLLTNSYSVLVNGVNYVTSATLVNDYIPTGTYGVEIASRLLGTLKTAGNISMCYFTTDYIDFSQEVNRLKFVDGLGYPLDLKKQIEAGIIPKPLIYLPFDDPTNLGKNLGTGGNFTVNGTVTQGADVNG